MKKNRLLLYNTLTGKALEYDEEYQEIINLVKRLKLKKNSMVVNITDSKIRHSPLIESFLEDIKEYFMGDVIKNSMVSSRPFQMIPILNIFRDVNKLKKMRGRSVGEDIKKYLNEITFYITTQCPQDCGICNKVHKQFLFCYKGAGKYELAPEIVKNILVGSSLSSLTQINFIGGDISSYSKIKQLARSLKVFPWKKVFYIHYLNLVKCQKFLDLLAEIGAELVVLIDSPIKTDALINVYRYVLKSKIFTYWNFALQCESEIEKVNEIKSTISIKDIKLKPFFNGENMDFFKKYVFIKDKDSLFNLRLSLKELYSRQVMNPLNFGKAFVKADGKVVTDINALSKYNKSGYDSIYDAIYNEMLKGKNWFRIRANVKPCRNCVFNLFCPPLSNYEYAIGRNNLCHIFCGRE